jgi:hypothetical protein
MFLILGQFEGTGVVGGAGSRKWREPAPKQRVKVGEFPRPGSSMQVSNLDLGIKLAAAMHIRNGTATKLCCAVFMAAPRGACSHIP